MVVARKPGEAANRTNDVALKAALHLTRSSALWGRNLRPEQRTASGTIQAFYAPMIMLLTR
jgi:hypothetical protein